MNPSWWQFKEQEMPAGWYLKADEPKADSIYTGVYIDREGGELKAASSPNNLLYGYALKHSGGGWVWGPMPLPTP